MLTAGMGIALSDTVILDIAFRYTDLGRVRTEIGRMYMNNVPDGIVIGETWTRLRAQGLSVGVRYHF
jgi:opacity protein-like surface antigen